MMNIFVSNDDGINADGIQQLIEELRRLGHSVYVCAPSSDRSCSGHGLSLGKEVEVFEISENVYSCTGLPADCTHIGIRYLFSNIKFDLSIAGINHGANLGQDIYYSGTLAAAREASFLDIPSISLSVCLGGKNFKKIHFCSIFKYLNNYLNGQLFDNFERGDVLNVNYPNLPSSELKGIELTRLGYRIYSNDILKNNNKFIIKGKYEGVDSRLADIDSIAVEKGLVSVTKIKVF